jgi:hypothetical protein
MRNRNGLITRTAILLVAGCLIACRQSEPGPASASGTLPPPPNGELAYGGAPIKDPFTQQPGNYLARTVFQTDGPGNSHIEVRDLLIPPQTKSTVEALPGSAVVEPVTGQLTLSAGNKPEMLALGAMRSLPAGQALQIENSDSRPANIRLYVVRAR